MSPVSPLEELFSSEFLRWRYFEALSASFLLQLVVSAVVCSAFKTICFDFVWNPLMWVYYFSNGIILPSFVFRILVPAICLIILARIHVHSYAVSWWIPEKRLQYIFQFLQPKKILYSLALIFVSMFLLHYYAVLIHSDLSNLTIECQNDASDTCVNHQTLLMLYLGMVFGIRLSFKYFLYNYKVIQFPVSQPNLLIQLKSRLKLSSVMESCSVFDVNIEFFAFIFVTYLLFGGMISHWIGPFVGIAVSSKSSSSVWSVLPVILDARFIFTLITCLILLAFSFHCFLLNFQEFITKSIELPICYDESPSVTSDAQVVSNWTLTSGMVSSCELLQLLAFKHFRDIAADETGWGAFNRAQIFAISQPGGHPRNWQSIVNPCLNLIRKFCERLKQQNITEDKISPLSQIDARQTIDLNKKNLDQKLRFTIREKWNKMKERLRQLPFVWYLLADIPDAKNRQIFAESQSVIWAVEGLSNLVAKSYTDDQFGVVQKNISDILTTLVQTQMIVEKVSRTLPNRRINQKFEMCPQDYQLRRSLRMTLRTSLYIITNSFKGSIREICTSEDVKTKLESYLAFQEG